MTKIEIKIKNAMLCMTRQCWEQGIAAEALLETEDFDSLGIVVYDMVLRQSEDGRLCNVENTPAVTDSSFCIPPVFLYGKMVKNTHYLKAAEKNMEYLLHQAERTEDGILFHIRGTNEIWADSAAFLPYSMALLGHPEEGVSQMKGILRKLRSKTGRYYHKWDEKEKNWSRKVEWGIGNGWILTGLLRLYTVLPDESPGKREILDTYRELLDAILSCESREHLFHDSLDEPDSFLETEVSEMVAYAIYRGIEEGMIGNAYLPRADQIRKAVYQKIDEFGRLKDSSSSPCFSSPGTSVESQAHFLMMEQAYRRMKR